MNSPKFAVAITGAIARFRGPAVALRTGPTGQSRPLATNEARNRYEPLRLATTRLPENFAQRGFSVVRPYR